MIELADKFDHRHHVHWSEIVAEGIVMDGLFWDECTIALAIRQDIDILTDVQSYKIYFKRVDSE